MLKSLKDMLFVDGDGNQLAKPVTTNSGTAPLAPAGQTVSLQPGAPLMNDPRNTVIYAKVRESIFSRTTAYTSLMDAAEKLSSIIPDPVQRLKAAHVTSSTGRTVQQIADAVPMHLADIEGEGIRFKQAIEAKRSQVIGALNAKKVSADAAIKSANEEIERLTQRIQQLHQQMANAQNDSAGVASEITIAEADINNAINEFNSAANTLRDELNLGKATILSSLS